MRIFADISVSLDGFAAGPDTTLEEPLGRGGEQLHEWAFRLAAWRAPHGLEGGETGPESDQVEQMLAATGATVMGRKMFSGGAGPWADDPNANGWWGDEPPFHHPVFVVTQHAREPLPLQGGTTFFFVDGVERALDAARSAADGRDVQIAGGASMVQQYLALGALDELQLHFAPVFLGSGTRLFDETTPSKLEIAETLASDYQTYVRYRVRRR
jgi:dihydrofolate reductase